jgi:hypothetical protein
MMWNNIYIFVLLVSYKQSPWHKRQIFRSITSYDIILHRILSISWSTIKIPSNNVDQKFTKQGNRRKNVYMKRERERKRYKSLSVFNSMCLYVGVNIVLRNTWINRYLSLFRVRSYVYDFSILLYYHMWFSPFSPTIDLFLLSFQYMYFSTTHSKVTMFEVSFRDL